jgi:glycosyltransferase involved in cell wall biosynthesis
MRTSPPKISVCIPAYNTTDYLSELLESIVEQDYDDYEIFVSDDKSPFSEEICKITKRFINTRPNIPIHYYKNEENLGYDANLRTLIRKAHGEYCLFMGDDDLMCVGALKRAGEALEKYDDIGVLLRSYVSVERQTKRIIQYYKYFDGDRFFEAGPETVITFFRRSVVISGMTVHRQASLKCQTDKFDGTLLYQLYLAGNILLEMNGIYIAEPIVMYRTGGVHQFGSSKKERDKYKPKVTTPEHSLNFMKGMFEIARTIGEKHDKPIYKRIVDDLGNYSYGFLAIQAKNIKDFLWYSYQLARMGLWKNKMFVIYVLLLLCFRPRFIDFVIGQIKRKMGKTPLFGDIYTGKSIS